ncbi:MAG: hypothetical protein NZ893_03225 [Candidatus Aenigmarchaeota archaeon]|nr:hypothetical protein [Candidatus Aenigmarchaeota archaeon]
MNENPKKLFKIADIWLASALSLALKVEPKLSLEDGRVIFSFPATDGLLEIMQGISSGKIKFDFISYSEKVKQLKHQLIVMKKGGKDASSM